MALTTSGTLLTLSHARPSLWHHLRTFCHPLRSRCDMDLSRRSQAVHSIASAFFSCFNSDRQPFQWRKTFVSCICKLDYPKFNVSWRGNNRRIYLIKWFRKNKASSKPPIKWSNNPLLPALLQEPRQTHWKYKGKQGGTARNSLYSAVLW